ncbi:MAG: alpha/beta hydrolase [Clostridiales bacterium]|nr:alpha/beta hydrolase [Clostridiales bacterium]
MSKEIMYVQAQDCMLYCEKRGQGPLLVIMPDGNNDAGPYEGIADMLADEFTVVVFDPREGSRSIPSVHQPVGAELLADDIAAIIKHMDMGKASVFGVSSGGQGALMVGVKYPELIKNVIIHEAALCGPEDVPIPNACGAYFMGFNQTYGPHLTGMNVTPFHAAMYVTVFPERDFSPEVNARMAQNGPVWGQYYFGVQDQQSYTEEMLAKIPACDFTVGCWTPSFQVIANIRTANRGGFEYTWLPSGHYPMITCPDVLVDHIRKTIHKYD